MTPLGDLLRERREARGFSLQSVSSSTKIREHILVALESGTYDCLPAPVFVRGFLRTLARHLGLDADELLALYVAAVPQSVAPSAVPAPANAGGYANGHTNGNGHAASNGHANGNGHAISSGHTNGNGHAISSGHTNGNGHAISNGYVNGNGHSNGNGNGHTNGNGNVALESAPTPPPALKPHLKPVWVRPSWLSGNVLMSGLIVVLLTVGVAWGGDQMLKGLGQSQPARALNDLKPTIEAIVLQPTPTDDFALNPTPSSTPAPPPPAVSIFAATPTPLGAAQHSLDVKLDMPGRSWVRVDEDGVTVFQGTLEAGTSKTFSAKNRITLRAGNGAGVSVSVNGSAQGALGATGDVVDRQWVLSDNGTVSTTPPVWTTNPP